MWAEALWKLQHWAVIHDWLSALSLDWTVLYGSYQVFDSHASNVDESTEQGGSIQPFEKFALHCAYISWLLVLDGTGYMFMAGHTYFVAFKKRFGAPLKAVSRLCTWEPAGRAFVSVFIFTVARETCRHPYCLLARWTWGYFSLWRRVHLRLWSTIRGSQ